LKIRKVFSDEFQTMGRRQREHRRDGKEIFRITGGRGKNARAIIRALAGNCFLQNQAHPASAGVEITDSQTMAT